MCNSTHQTIYSLTGSQPDVSLEKMVTWSRFCSSKFGGAELVRAGIYKHKGTFPHLKTYFELFSTWKQESRQLASSVQNNNTCIPFIKPGLMDPNWKENPLDASPGAEPLEKTSRTLTAVTYQYFIFKMFLCAWSTLLHCSFDKPMSRESKISIITVF